MMRALSRFDPEHLLRPRSIAVVGADSPAGRRVMQNLRAAGFPGSLEAVDGPSAPDLAPDLGIVAEGPLQPGYAMLAGAGAGVVIALGPGAWEAGSCRMMGPGAFGVIVPGAGLNASLAHVPARRGKLALISPSAALCRTVLDWAEPNGVGFSHMIGLGAEADIDLAVVLDILSREPATGAILIDIRGVRDRRAFMSACRAAARLRPVVAIHAGGRQRDPSGQADRVLEAALRRAGVLRVTTLAELLAAAETLTRARPARSEALMVVTNAVGPGQLAADHAVRSEIPLARPDLSAQAVLLANLPPQPADPGMVWTGEEQPTRVAETACMISALPEVGGVVAVLAPTGDGDGTAIEALAAAQPTLKLPLLACVLGETTGAPHRRVLADAGIPVFASPEQAVRGFAQLVRLRRARAVARELPSRQVLDVMPDLEAAKRAVAAAREAGRDRVEAEAARAVLSAYGIAADRPGEGAMLQIVAAPAALQIIVADDTLFGPAIGLGPGDRIDALSFELPPLNLGLAAALAERARVATSDVPGVADVLVRVSQLVIDIPEIADLHIDLRATRVAAASIGLRPAGQQAHLAIPPYPEELLERWNAGGEPIEIRPIRPEDAEAEAALFHRLPQEDIRFRFFSTMRDLSPEQIARLTNIDYDREMAFVAVRGADLVGVARLVRELPGSEGEFAIVVDAAMKGRGLGRRLMERLMGWGRQQGMTDIVGQVLAENAPMLAFVRRLGFAVRRSPGDPDVVDARLKL